VWIGKEVKGCVQFDFFPPFEGKKRKRTPHPPPFFTKSVSDLTK
jgi:hypothetical protein